jgi:hypothetical protein
MPRGTPGWYRLAAAVMARNSCGLKQAAFEIDKQLTAEECEIVARRVEFQEILLEEEDKYRGNLATRPSRSKEVAVGIMLEAIDKLMKQGDYDKAATAIEKLAKLEGWTSGESNINIFSGVTARDIAHEREKLEQKLRENPDKPSPLPN